MKGKKKYIKYGKLSGKIFLNHLSEAECIALGKVFGRSLLPGDFVFSIASYRRHWRRRNIVVSKRRPGQIFPWRITAEDYYRSISNEMLTEKRLTRLDKITNVQLRELAKLLKAAKKAGYQEHLIDLMVEDIKAIK